MNAIPACIPCYLKQALNAAKEITDDPAKLREVVNAVSKILDDLPLDRSPAENSTKALLKVNELLQNNDPFYHQKKYYNKYALTLYPELKELVENSSDPLRQAIKIAVAGNIIDLGIRDSIDVKSEIQNILTQSFTIDNSEMFIKDVSLASTILYNGDNSGEIVFDKLLVEELNTLGKTVYFAVKGSPILNDVTVEDAQETGMDSVARIISNGSPMVGTILATCSDEYRSVFDSADLVISKGQGNFETLDRVNKNIYFILKAKCEEVAAELGVAFGDIVIMKSKSYTG